jgi:glycosyltransferase involved in cell wall biosynthesis
MKTINYNINKAHIYIMSKRQPFVSICTPTFNRRPFIPYIIKCIESQTYSKKRIEWVIIDDGTDKIEDLVSHIPYVKYSYYPEKMTLGKKRNLAHAKSEGSIIVYMDDDDYYPPERISHAVETLKANPSALCAGSSMMHIYFKHINQMYSFGPYGPNHSTAATFAFKRELLSHTSYEETASLAEEKHFLKNYTIPFVQLEPLKTILVFSHVHNSLDKKTLIEENNLNQFVKVSPVKVSDFIKEPELVNFYINDIDALLEKYTQGKPENKPDVMKQLEEMTRNREKMVLEHQLQQTQQQAYQYIQQIQSQLSQALLENTHLKEKNEYLENKIKSIITQQINSYKNK